MTKKKILGYIVYSRFGVKMLGEFNVLWLDASATLFKSRGSAKAAIKRSEKYAASRFYGTDGPWFNNEIMPVTN
jgi:hypothetical protein